MITNPTIRMMYYAPGLGESGERTVERVVLLEVRDDLPADYDCIVRPIADLKGRLFWTKKNLFATYAECLHAKI